MLNFIKNLFKTLLDKLLFKLPKRTVIHAEDVIYQSDRVYILYEIVKNNFHYCMQHGLLKRKDILEFKFMLNRIVNQNNYKHEEFKNDAHEIYAKLKSRSITKNNMLQLNNFLQPFIALNTAPVPQTQAVKQYGNLLVIK